MAFGSKVEMMTSQVQLESEQWRASGRHRGLPLRPVDARGRASPDRLMAMGAVIFRSTGLHADGAKFPRHGRVTVTLIRRPIGAPWICTHSHVSLKPGTPAPSHGKRPERV